ncbi:hypothetical protein EW145_g203 [Phellinidium pouzarii]|uniref:Uncharacterized protein n=1 Tax=Phellinidium pouzarii TaxID=167371 RepID=A0A4S4LJJ2_9AGAM|nr:hypothetical protein EW145_g203 [Phellinidium pouzarii]
MFGVAATAWGLYEFYMTLTIWPKEVRTDLRAGLRAKERGDLKLSQRHLANAWRIVQTLPSDSLAPNPYLKVSGIAIVLAEVLEADRQLDQAFSVLRDALLNFPNQEQLPSSATLFVSPASNPNSAPSPSPSSLSTSATTSKTVPHSDSAKPASIVKTTHREDTRTRMRAVAISLKLGALAEALSRPADEELWLEFAVEEVLSILLTDYGLKHDVHLGFVNTNSRAVAGKALTYVQGRAGEDASGEQGQQIAPHDHRIRDIFSPDSTDSDLGLPTWVSLTKTELAAPLERLGSFYTRQGKTMQGIMLYRVASNLLVHPKPVAPLSPGSKTVPSTLELCQALQIENAHMALLMGLHREHPEDAVISRDIPRVLRRASIIYDEAERRRVYKRSPAGNNSDVGEGAADSDNVLCDMVYPAIIFNAGVYYEEEGLLNESLTSYQLAYQMMHGRGEQAQEAVEGVRRIQKALGKEKQSRLLIKHENSAPAGKA